MKLVDSKGPGLDHIFVWLGPALPTPPSLHGLPVCTCVGTLFIGNQCDNTRSRLQIKVDIAFIISKLMNGVPSHAKGA